MAEDVSVGETIVGPSRTITRDKMIAFEAVVWDRGPTAHNDPETAAQGGLRRMLTLQPSPTTLGPLGNMPPSEFARKSTLEKQVA